MATPEEVAKAAKNKVVQKAVAAGAAVLVGAVIAEAIKSRNKPAAKATPKPASA